MTDGYEILSSIIMATQSAQTDLSAAIEFVSSTAMKSVLAEALQTYDRIESEAQRLASQRGWEMMPNRQFLEQMKQRIQLRSCKTDSAIGEFLIIYYTDNLIRGLSIYNQDQTYDEQISRLFQKFLFCQSSNIRQMYPYL